MTETAEAFHRKDLIGESALFEAESTWLQSVDAVCIDINPVLFGMPYHANQKNPVMPDTRHIDRATSREMAYFQWILGLVAVYKGKSKKI